jgi:hypothetical protein
VANPTYVTIDITSVEVTCLFAGNQLRDCFVNKGIDAVCDAGRYLDAVPTGLVAAGRVGLFETGSAGRTDF